MDASLSQRLDRVQRALTDAGDDWLLIPASADFRWLTGGSARSTERLLCLAVPRQGAPFCLVPKLEADALAAESPTLEQVIWSDGDDAFTRLAERLGLERRPSLRVGEGFRAGPLLAMAARTRCQTATALLEPLRAIKDAEEIRHLVEAGRHADQVVLEIVEFMRPGMTEREVARFAFERFEALGDTDPWAIVASGPHGALPHHMTSGRRLAEGEVVVVDVGASTEGYASDITRTFWLGAPPPEAERVYAVVDEARAAGIAAVRAGVETGAVDRAAREVIERAGYGEFFTHRTGHGLGLEIHEPPYIVGGTHELLRAGMAHTVEPGIYLPGRFGIRLEDSVIVETDRARRLNQVPFEPAPQRVRG
jgi:Xaa-Pro aminopeptidase